jgi:hypothetical protein
MPMLRVPVADLHHLSVQFRRLAIEVIETEAALAAGLAQLDPASRKQLGLEAQLAEAHQRARRLSEGAESLGRQLGLAASAFAEADRQAAASMPDGPRPDFLLPPAMPPKRPWPYARLPVATIVRLVKRVAGQGGGPAPARPANLYE